MANSADELRRWLGAFCLVVAAGLLIWGQTVLQPHLQGFWFAAYWTLCFLFTVGAIVIALLDLRAVRRRARNQQRALLERTLHEVDTEYAPKPPDPSDPGPAKKP